MGCVSLGMPKLAFPSVPKIMKRAIPSSGQKIACVGLGTWQTFDVRSSNGERDPLKEVLKTLVQYGGQVVDSSPMYGRSERVVGELATELGIANKLFYATKVWTRGESSGKSQMKSSMSKMKANPMDLMQVHNLQDWRTHLKTLYKWKESGLVKYIGITHYTPGAHGEMERILKSESIDFIQVNYSITDRNAERSLLPAARDHGVAVMTNRPYSGGSLFGKVRGKQLPAWAGEFDCNSWGQFFLKYVLSNPATTCVIPGTSKAKHMKDNLGAGLGRLPDERERKKMVALLNTL